MLTHHRLLLRLLLLRSLRLRLLLLLRVYHLLHARLRAALEHVEILIHRRVDVRKVSWSHRDLLLLRWSLLLLLLLRLRSLLAEDSRTGRMRLAPLLVKELLLSLLVNHRHVRERRLVGPDRRPHTRCHSALVRRHNTARSGIGRRRDNWRSRLIWRLCWSRHKLGARIPLAQHLTQCLTRLRSRSLGRKSRPDRLLREESRRRWNVVGLLDSLRSRSGIVVPLMRWLRRWIHSGGYRTLISNNRLEKKEVRINLSNLKI